MGKIEKSTGLQGLAKYRVYIDDTSPTSKAFALSDIPDILTIGKNAFLINGSPYLQQTTDVLVEIVDSAGNSVYTAPIKNYVEGLARVVSIEVYADTAPGIGLITILGELREDFQGHAIPDEWAKVYNVKWQKQIQIDPFKTNTTPIRLYQRPSLDVGEIFNDAREVSGSTIIHFSTGSVSGKSLNQFSGSFNNSYGLIFSEKNLVKEMADGTFTATINGVLYTTSISSVLNSSVLIVASPYSVNGTPTDFSISGYSFTYPSPKTYSYSPVRDAFAQLTLSNLTTFSGDLRRVKLFVKPVDVDIDYYLISDTVLTATDLLVAPARGELEFNFGYIADQNVIDTFWKPFAIVGGIRANGMYKANGCVLGNATLGQCPPVGNYIVADGTLFADGSVLADDTLVVNETSIFADGGIYADGTHTSDGR